MKLVGDPSKWIMTYQDIQVQGEAGSTFTISGFSKVENPKPNGGIYGYIINTYDSSVGSGYVEKFTLLNAMAAAFEKAGKPYKYEHKGWEILKDDTQNGLKKGDLLLEVGGISLKQSDEFFLDDLEKLYDEKKVGDSVTYKVLRGEKNLNIEAKIFEEDGEKFDTVIGNSPIKQRIYFESPVKFSYQVPEDTGGPSAGLIISLAILDKLLPEDLTKGYKIAGTGTISADGRVGMVSGEDFKVLGADTGEAKIFFCPKENAPLAKKTAEEFGLDIKVVPVTTLDEAVEYLRNMQ